MTTTEQLSLMKFATNCIPIFIKVCAKACDRISHASNGHTCLLLNLIEKCLNRINITNWTAYVYLGFSKTQKKYWLISHQKQYLLNTFLETLCFSELLRNYSQVFLVFPWMEVYSALGNLMAPIGNLCSLCEPKWSRGFEGLLWRPPIGYGAKPQDIFKI